MRIRSIKPEFWRSEDITVLDWETRLLFIGLWSYVDDNGVGIDRKASIAADLFAQDLEDDAPDTFARVSRGLQTLSDKGRITRYKVAGKRFLHITNWDKHQRIDKPNKPRYPLPTCEDAEIRESSATHSRESRETPAPGTGEQGNRGTGEQTSSSEVADAPPTRRDDVERICSRLAEHIEANGGKRPNVTKGWRDAARLLIDRDGRTEQQVAWMIDWCQRDEFWHANILSMPKLREKFDQMLMKAKPSSSANTGLRLAANGEPYLPPALDDRR